jgi:hypothetical protein
MADDKKLPDLPGSTEQDLKMNPFHPFFKKTPRQFWEEADIEHPVLSKETKCEHIFEKNSVGVECKKCHMGLKGEMDVIDGKLFFKGQPILA